MKKSRLSREQIIERDVQDLQRLGYTQQLFREIGSFSNFGISFSIISVLTGAILLYGYGLRFAGPIVNSVGWPLVSVFTICVAACMAEIASAYPTAGGLYFWAYRLGGPGWAWITAWLNMIGQVAITAGINIAAAIYAIGALTRILNIDPETSLPLFGSLTSWAFQVMFMGAIMIPQVLINVFGIKLTARVTNFSVYWHIAGVLIITFLLTVAGGHHNSLEFLFSRESAANPLDASSAHIRGTELQPALIIGEWKVPSPLFALLPWLRDLYGSAPYALMFVLALLQAQWTYNGYDASAHVAEETLLPRQNSAWGIFLSVAVSAVVGYILMLVLTWCIPYGDISTTASDPYPVLYIVYSNLSAFFANAIAVIIGVAMWLCGLSSITSMGRMWYAFARDDGPPGSQFLKKIHPKYRTPMNAIVITSLLAIAICLYAAAYFVVTSISTIALYLAYVIPIYLNRRNRSRKSGEYTTPHTAPWNLGRWSPAISAIAIVWVLFITVVFSIPPNELVLWTMLLLGFLLWMYWWISARRTFTGPRVPGNPNGTP